MADNKSVPRNLTYAKVYHYALELFGFDKDKTNAWWMSQLEELGMSPFEMVKLGKGRQIMRLIDKAR